MCQIQTTLSPFGLLDRLKEIERRLGRVKAAQRFGPRAVDLDILYYHEDEDPSRIITVARQGERNGSDEGSLFVPHTRLHEREFVLRPLAELAPWLSHPLRGNLTVRQMLGACEESRSETSSPLVRVLPLRWQEGDNMLLLPLDNKHRGTPSLVMGILNATPDSFSDGGKDGGCVNSAVERALGMRDQGATIIDIGGESTRPGASEVEEKKELGRVLPIIEGIRAQDKNVLLSIDTRRAVIAQAAVEAGADVINDVSGGAFDSEMLPAVAALNVPYVIMHTRGTPQTMTEAVHTTYSKDPVGDVVRELRRAVRRAERKGVRRWSMIVDPGIGFAKDLETNIALLRGLDRLNEEIAGLPLLVGASRKRFIGTLCGETQADKRDVGTSVVNAVAILRGAALLRVHNVAMARQTVRLADTLR